MNAAHRDHEQFFQLIARLRAVAEKHGDRAFAGALSDCLGLASSAESRCPIARLIVQDYGEMPHPPTANGDPSHRLGPLVATEPPPYEPERLLGYVHHALEERAVLKGDTH